MSYSYNHRKKIIRRFKATYSNPYIQGKAVWYKKFREFVNKLVEDRRGPAICLSDLVRGGHKC